jgi:hypothetical protein
MKTVHATIPVKNVNELSGKAKTFHALPDDALQMLRAAVEAPGQSMNTVRVKLGCSRTAVSLCLSGKYSASTRKMAALIRERLGHVECPHLEREITGIECSNFHDREAPTSSPLAMRHWRACQRCPHNRRKA